MSSNLENCMQKLAFTPPGMEVYDYYYQASEKFDRECVKCERDLYY